MSKASAFLLLSLALAGCAAPVTNSQEPDVKSFKVDTEKLEADKATITVTIAGHRNDRKPADQIARYVLLREVNSWKIDDIKGASDGQAWSIRRMSTDSLKRADGRRHERCHRQ
jgi:hypothetical protein